MRISSSPFSRVSPLRNPGLAQISKEQTLGAIDSPINHSLYGRNSSFGGNTSQVEVLNPDALAQLKKIKANPPPWMRVEEENGSTWLVVDYDLAALHANPACIYDDVKTTPWWGYHPLTNVYFPSPEEEVTAHHSVTNTLVKEPEGGQRYESLTKEEELESDQIAQGTFSGEESRPKLDEEDHQCLNGFLEGYQPGDYSPEDLLRELTIDIKVEEVIEKEDTLEQPIFLTSTITEISEEETETELGPEMSYLSLIRTPWDQPDELLLEPLSVETPAVMYLTH